MKMIISGVVILVGVSTVFFFATKEKTLDRGRSFAEKAKAEIVIKPQIATSTVTIESVNLPQAGFLAVRSIDNGRLGQIIEISRYLTAGTYTNITIALGDFYEGGGELIVMAYGDKGDDKTFNDLDQPIMIDGAPLSAYVATGASVPVSITTNTGNADTIHTMDNTAMATVRYTDSGFEPKELSVPLGTMVRFTNESTQKMWVASNEHPGHSILPTFDQFSPSGEYSYVFDTKGSWQYHDHLNPTALGVIIVEEE